MTETESEQMLLEKWMDLLDAGLPQTCNLFKKKNKQLSVKHNNSENAVKQGMPLFII